MGNNSVASFWDDEVMPEQRHADPITVKGTPPRNRPRPGELDVRVYEISNKFAFCNAWDYNNNGLLIGRDSISPVQVAIHVSDIIHAYPERLREGARFRVIPSKSRPDSTFEYFGKLVAAL